MLSTSIHNKLDNESQIELRTSSRSEKARKKIVRLVFIVYWLLIFEGALRKWAFPQYHEIIFFARDPFVLVIYFLAWRYRIVQRDKLLTVGLVISVIFIPLILAQIIVININPLTLIYGWRMYFFYLPLVFVIKDAFDVNDITKLIRQTLYVSIPLSILVYIQYISPPGSYINAGYSTGHIFVVANNIVRTTGTFTFTAGQTMFAGSLVAMLLIAWLQRKQNNVISILGLLLATGAGMTTLLLSGSRTAFFMAGLVVLATLFGLFLTRSMKKKFHGIALLVFLVIVGAMLFLGPYKKSFDALGTRFQQAEASEGSPFRRAFLPLILFTQRLTTTPVLGYGLGYGTSGGSKLATGKTQILLPEDELSRVAMEVGPAFGLLYIGYRVYFTFVLLARCMRSARQYNDLVPMIFLGFIGFYMLAGNITQTGTVHGYNWIFLGLLMSAAQKKKQPEQSRNRTELSI